jgi:hypothetical protein
VSYLDREGRPISLLQWAVLWDDPAYRYVRTTRVGAVTIRTVWEGLGERPGALFCTGMSGPGAPQAWRTIAEAASEAEAAVDHRHAVALVRLHTSEPGRQGQ